jgi:hypothetical protein
MEDACEYRRSLRNFQSRVARVIGVDVDEAVMKNPAVDEAYVFNPKDRLPIDDASIESIVSDWTFEHVFNSAQTSELNPVLKPGGFAPEHQTVKGTSHMRTVECRKRSRCECSKSRGPRGSKKVCFFPALYLMNSFGAFEVFPFRSF